jgi:hypothetical protein
MNELLKWLDEQIAECQVDILKRLDSDGGVDFLHASIKLGYAVAYNEVKTHLKAEAAETKRLNDELTQLRAIVGQLSLTAICQCGYSIKDAEQIRAQCEETSQ